MDEGASPEMGVFQDQPEDDDLLFDAERRRLDEKRLRLDEERSHLQAWAEERLQKAATAYNIDREADEQNIKDKEVALAESEEALLNAIDRKETCKRKHEAYVQKLLDDFPGIKRSKQSDVGLPSDQGKQKDSGPLTPQNQPVAARVEAATQNRANEPQSDYHSDRDDAHHLSHVEGPPAKPQNLSLTKKTITYDEVYRLARDPAARYKHWIVERCGNWYIVRCAKHCLNWGNDPIKAANIHLRSQFHGFPGRDNLAVEELGELVEGCDQEKASISNAEYQKALDKDYSCNNTMYKARQKRPAKPVTRSVQEASEGVIDPVVGEVYYAWWDRDPPHNWFSVVILPYLGDGDWKEVGIAGNLFSSVLEDHIPNCFKKVKVTKDSGEKAFELKWAEGYEDGGPRVHSRQFPCLFLHSPLKIPPADQEFTSDHLVEVLEFQPAKLLRPRSTVLPEGLDTMGVSSYQKLAQDFEARLKAIRGKQETIHAAIDQVSIQDQQHPITGLSAKSMESPQRSSVHSAPQHRSTDSDLSMSFRKSTTSDQYFPRSAMGGYGSIQGMADFGSTHQPWGRPQQAAGVPAPSNPQALQPPKAAGPSALRPPGWKRNAIHTKEVPEQDRMSRRGHSTDILEKRDLMPNNSGGKTSWLDDLDASFAQRH